MKILAAVRAFFAAVLALLWCTQAAFAQSWQWQVVVHPAGAAPVNAYSRVTLANGEITMSYSAVIHQREVPIASCRVRLGDVAGAEAVQKSGRTFLLVHLKAQSPSGCDGGAQQAAMVPVSDDADAARVATAIVRACCTPAAVAVRPAPSAAPVPARSPSAAPSPAKELHPADWVEKDGAFAFIRLRNRFSQAVTVTGGEVSNCTNVAAGCGSFAGITLQPGGVATIATVMAAVGNGPAFSYRYSGESGGVPVSGAGSSTKVATGWRPRMSPRDIQVAEDGAMASVRDHPKAGESPAPSATSSPPASAAARLVRRGSTRLGIGQTGIARVSVKLDTSGVPHDASVVSVSNPQLAAAALELAVSSTYTPAIHGGKPVASTYVATFQFDGQDPATAQIPVWRRDASPAPSASP